MRRDRFPISRLEGRTDSPVLRAMVRGPLTVARSTANLASVQPPWHGSIAARAERPEYRCSPSKVFPSRSHCRRTTRRWRVNLSTPSGRGSTRTVQRRRHRDLRARHRAHVRGRAVRRLAHRLQRRHDAQPGRGTAARTERARPSSCTSSARSRWSSGCGPSRSSLAIAASRGWATATHYLNDTVNYTEALFVVVIMALASTRPIVALAERALRRRRAPRAAARRPRGG